ncbi:MAG: lysoplasmalogenase [Spirosomataceae bacterium]
MTYTNLKPKVMRLKLLIFSVIVVAEIACSYAGTWQGVYLLKPLIMLSLLYWTWPYRAAHPWLWIGMWFGLGGDVFLMIRQKDLFVAGLGSFLVMQLCYIVAFGKTYTAEGRKVLRKIGWRLALPFVIYGLSFLSLLYPSMTHNTKTQGLWWPVVAYAICLCSMGIAAAFRKGSTSGISYTWVLAGATLFILSDSSIAINKFLVNFSASSLLIMTTYAAAQWLIVWGVLEKREL